MSAIESETAIEKINPRDLTRALNDAFGVYQRGRNGGALAIRVYSELDRLAGASSSSAGDEGSLIRFAKKAQIDDASHSTIQRRTANMNLTDNFSWPFNEFEGAPIASYVTGFRDLAETTARMVIGAQGRFENNRLRNLGLFYLHLSGLTTNGSDVLSHGFAKTEPTFRDLLSADYLYNRGLRMLGSYLYGEKGKGSWLDKEYKLRGVKKASGKRSDEIIKGMYSDKGEMEAVIVGSRPYVFEAWERFLERGPVLTPEQMRIALGLRDSYERQIERDVSVGDMPETDFSEVSPVAPFFDFAGPSEHRGITLAKGMIGQINLPPIR